MAVKLYDLARMTTATVGTGTITLGAAVPPFLTFAQAGVQDQDVVRYAIYDVVGNVCEIGSGTYTASGTTLTRNPTTSSNSNGLVFLSGQAQVFITASLIDFQAIPTGARAQLTRNATYYVNTSASSGVAGPGGSVSVGGGNDSTGNGSATAPWKTLQKAYNVINAGVDCAGFVVAILLAHGSSTDYSLIAENGPILGQSSILIQGDSSSISAVTIVAPNAGSCLAVKDGATVEYDSVTFADSAGANSTVLVQAGLGGYGHIDISNCSFSAANSSCVLLSTTYSGSISLTGPITIHGAGIALECTNGGVIDCGSSTVTVSGTPAYAICFAYTLNSGVINASSSTFSGSATGQKFQINGLPGISGYDPAAVFPGNSAGTAILAPSSVTLSDQLNLATFSNSSPVNGDIWFDGTNFKVRTGGVTKTITIS